jgi:hypothetical protein
MPKQQKSKHPRDARFKLSEPLANALRLFGYNWRARPLRAGNLWTIYRYGKSEPDARKNRQTWTLHSEADPDAVVRWLAARARGEPGRPHWLGRCIDRVGPEGELSLEAQALREML